MLIGRERIKVNGKFVSMYEHFKDGLLLCCRCEKYKDESCFGKRSRIIERNCKNYDCKECSSIIKRQQYIETKDIKIKNLTLEGYLKTVLNHAKRRKHEFNLTLEDLINLYDKQKGLCIYTKQKLTYILGKGVVNTNLSLDRIDSNKGYIKDNIQLTSRAVNIMKSNYTEKEFIDLCKLVSTNN